jgi:hypothetical protein
VSGFEDRVLLAEVHPRRHAETPDETGTEVRDDVAVEVRKNDDV